ncbi:MAG: sensor histidine kinase [Gaiellaceae bacterium]
MPAPASELPNSFKGSSPRSLRRGDAIIWRAYAAVALPVGILYFFVGPDAQTLVYQAFSVSALVAILVGIRRHRPAPAYHWWLFAGGIAMWCLGDAYWDTYRWILQTEAPYPSPADLAFFMGYPFLVAGLFTLARGWGRPRLGDILDGLIIVAAAAILTGLFLLGPIFGAESSSTLATINALGIPVADVVLLAALTQLVFRGRVRSFALRCIIVAIISTLVADPIYSYLSLKGTYDIGMPVDMGWLILYGLWAIAALHPSMARMASLPETKEETLSFWRIAALLTALLAAPVVLIAQTALGTRPNAYELGGVAILTTLLVGVRVVLLQRERRAVQAALAESERKFRELFEEAERGREALAAQNERLREVDGLKDDLIALVSHELRTPLTSIVGYLELVQEDEDELKEEHRNHLEVVQRNAHRLLSLVSDLLFAAQVQAGRVTLEKDLVSIPELLDQAVAAALPAAENSHIEMTVHVRDDAEVIGDRQRLAQVVDNLLSNALKFTPPNGSIGISVIARDDTVVIEVEDSGIGISAADQKRLFTRFFRSEAALRMAIKGPGLGLSIVKAIVEGHGGEITVESAEGKGATFRVVLPLAAATASQPVKEAA